MIIYAKHNIFIITRSTTGAAERVKTKYFDTIISVI